MNGWVKLHRKIGENIFLMKDNNAYIVFTKLLLLANSKGEIGQSTRELAETVNLNHSTLYKTLKRLEGETLIKQTSKHNYTIVYICNWGKYQEVGKHYGKQMVNTRETDGKRLTGVARIENKNKENGLVEESTAVSEKGLQLLRDRRKELRL